MASSSRPSSKKAGTPRIDGPVISAYLAAGWTENGLDALIPGCTHYPLVIDALRRCYDGVELVDGPTVVAAEVERRLDDAGLLATGAGPAADHRFAVSDLTTSFAESARRFFGSGIQLDRDSLWD